MGLWAVQSVVLSRVPWSGFAGQQHFTRTWGGYPTLERQKALGEGKHSFLKAGMNSAGVEMPPLSTASDLMMSLETQKRQVKKA